MDREGPGLAIMVALAVALAAIVAAVVGALIALVVFVDRQERECIQRNGAEYCKEVMP